MASTKAQLDDAAKAASRRQTLRRYADKNKKKLRAAAQQRMQRRRAKHKRWQSAPRPPDIARSRHISASGTKGLNQSCRNKVQLREADALRRPKKVKALQDEPMRVQTKAPRHNAEPVKRRHERWKRPEPATYRVWLPEELKGDTDGEISDGSEAITAGEFDHNRGGNFF
ncbi:hypothetical protein DFH09DRAFT_1088614 [Mycena vulgaris]|nr:hypothetical protein DFH09DRAFT_1088614 [Mycena vulgaris]